MDYKDFFLNKAFRVDLKSERTTTREYGQSDIENFTWNGGREFGYIYVLAITETPWGTRMWVVDLDEVLDAERRYQRFSEDSHYRYKDGNYVEVEDWIAPERVNEITIAGIDPEDYYFSFEKDERESYKYAIETYYKFYQVEF